MKIELKKQLFTIEGEPMIEDNGKDSTFFYISSLLLNTQLKKDTPEVKLEKGILLAKLSLAGAKDQKTIDLSLKELTHINESAKELLSPIYVAQFDAFCEGKKNPFEDVAKAKSKLKVTVEE